MEVLPGLALLEGAATWSLEAVAGRKLESPLMPPEVEESECHRSTKAAHPDPEPLLREFLQRAGRGEFLEGGAWFDEAVTCPGIEPGPDAFTVVAEARLREVLACGDTAVARVDYDVLGRAEGSTRFVPGRVAEHGVFQLRRTAQGWRIESSAIGLGQHVLAAWLLDAQRLSPRDRQEIRSMLAPTGASQPCALSWDGLIPGRWARRGACTSSAADPSHRDNETVGTRRVPVRRRASGSVRRRAVLPLRVCAVSSRR